ncbi:glucose-6-phosphate dehydrogenase [Candidatus Saccharibacteria bacterium]|nr:glucose-6-phosphate dehydrogenase [Candidatus Saccharibacteria bacterium]
MLNAAPTLPPASLVIFGITGDLANRKLLPALYYLEKYQLLPETFRLIGTTRRQLQVETVFEKLAQTLGEKAEPALLERLRARTEIVTMDMMNGADYQGLRNRLDTAEDAAGVCMARLFYLSVPAQQFSQMALRLGESGLQRGCRHDEAAESRLLIEKPFGYDLASARQLIADLATHFTEEQIYRVDHYLAKETAQNILTFRFRNPLFRTAWHAGTVKSIVVTAAEAIGIEGRTDFYEQTGALRDLIQSHVLQLLALVTMAEPESLSSEAIHARKLELLEAIQPISADDVPEQAVRGQYDTYRDETGNPTSTVETYAALRLSIDTEAWRGVPVLLRTGKALAEKTIDIRIDFTDESHLTDDNILTIRIQPGEGIGLQLLAKKPGLSDAVEPVHMDFSYHRSFDTPGGHPDAYERVLLDALRGDKTLFASADEVLASWRIIEAVVQRWGQDGTGLQFYTGGSWGPAAADELAEKAGASWR